MVQHFEFKCQQTVALTNTWLLQCVCVLCSTCQSTYHKPIQFRMDSPRCHSSNVALLPCAVCVIVLDKVLLLMCCLYTLFGTIANKSKRKANNFVVVCSVNVNIDVDHTIDRGTTAFSIQNLIIPRIQENWGNYQHVLAKGQRIIAILCNFCTLSTIYDRNIKKKYWKISQIFETNKSKERHDNYIAALI